MVTTPTVRVYPRRAEVNGAAPERVVELKASAKVENVTAVRRDVVRTLAGWGISGCRDAVELVCAELLTNALHYGEIDALEVELAVVADWLRVSVPDRNPYPPYPAHARADDEDGRGVFLVAAIADAWGFRIEGQKKCVYAEFCLS